MKQWTCSLPDQNPARPSCGISRAGAAGTELCQVVGPGEPRPALCFFSTTACISEGGLWSLGLTSTEDKDKDKSSGKLVTDVCS